MRILLDTHIYLWCLNDDKRLTKSARTLIEQAENVFVSSAAIWEMIIKSKLKKLDVDIDKAINAISQSGFEELPITIKHATSLQHLDNIHRDPFDRIMVAQAICEPLRFLTSDKILKSYSDLIEVV